VWTSKVYMFRRK